MAVELQRRYQIKGITFGARGCSCSCSPCDCDPCTCESNVRPPLWRVSGYSIQSGTIDDIDVSGQLLLSLAQPVEERSAVWQETLLVDKRATREQVAALLSLFEDQLESLPAEIEQRIFVRKALYTAEMHYKNGVIEPQLRITFIPDERTRVREGIDILPQPWSYHGPIALREQIAMSSMEVDTF